MKNEPIVEGKGWREASNVRLVHEGDLLDTLEAIGARTVRYEDQWMWRRFEPTDIAGDEQLPSDLLDGLRTYRDGHLGPIYVAGVGRYLIKCYDWDRPVARVGEPRIEYELLCLGQQRGVQTMPRAYAAGYLSVGRKGEERGGHVTTAVVEERIDGTSIAELLRFVAPGDSARRWLPAKDVARVSLALAEAIVDLRVLNVSHCNLSVDNVIVRGGVIGESPSVALTGFEHAMPIQPSPLVDPVYGIDPVYSAPESFFSRIPVNRVTLASDVWSLGAIVTTMLVGSEAWSWGASTRLRGSLALSDREMDELDRIRREPIDVAGLVARRARDTDGEGELIAELARVVEACTEYRARDRIGAEELVNALRGALLRAG
ncbi:MAG: hypothetical protein Q4A07_00445 [Coriobacteriales bacterium]|nr:hypothetical protein [Coriobacteriales bacterium]